MEDRTVEQVEYDILRVKGGVFDLSAQIKLHSNAIAGYEKKLEELYQFKVRLEQELELIKNCVIDPLIVKPVEPDKPEGTPICSRNRCSKSQY